MTSFSKSKSCEIELLTEQFMLQMEYLVMTGERSKIPDTPLELMPCAHKAKHSLIMGGKILGNPIRKKFRLCDFHFDYMCTKYERESTYADLPGIRLRRNRL